MKKFFITFLLLTPFTALFSDEEMPPMPQTIEYEGLFLKTVLSLLAIIVFVVIVYYLLRKMTGFRASKMNLIKNVKILEKRPLSPKSMLYLVEVAGRQFLLAESQLEIRPITQLDWIDEEPPEE